jgi:hypothetical protein
MNWLRRQLEPPPPPIVREIELNDGTVVYIPEACLQRVTASLFPALLKHGEVHLILGPVDVRGIRSGIMSAGVKTRVVTEDPRGEHAPADGQEDVTIKDL